MTLANTQSGAPAWAAIRANWRIYAIDGALLGVFMISACVSVAAIEHPYSPIRMWIQSDLARRALVGVCMGLTAVGLIYSRWGRRSGALMNPAVVIGFLRMKRIEPIDAAGFILAQFVGAVAGVLAPALLLGRLVSHPSVNFVVTAPGNAGLEVAWLGEFAIAFVMMAVVMAINKSPRLAPFTGCFAAALVCLYITFEAPISGMSLNPARTFGSAVVAGVWAGWWIYLTAPVLGMICGIELHRLLTAEHQKLCGKLNHSRSVACFIPCNCRRDSH